MSSIQPKLKLPEGYELAEEYPRQVRHGENYWGMGSGERGVRVWSPMSHSDGFYFILKKKAPLFIWPKVVEW